MDDLCETCRRSKATAVVTFVGPNHTSARMCDTCLSTEMDHYRNMGKPGQVSIVPIEQPRDDKQLQRVRKLDEISDGSESSGQ